MAYTVRIDKNSCQSAGNCVEAAPEGFGFDADALGDVKPAAGRLPRARLLEIARRCPALAITVFDESGNEVDPGS
jgi:ferredoxin